MTIGSFLIFPEFLCALFYIIVLSLVFIKKTVNAQPLSPPILPHIDKDNITNFLDILHAYPDLVSVIDHCGEVFMNVHQLLRTTSSIPTHDKCIIIRIILWQYCKILPYLTENEGLLYCGLYSDLNLESDRVSTSLHTQCLLFTALGVLSGALVSLGLTAMMT